MQLQFLITAHVEVCGPQGQRVQATVLFDSGSDRSYVSENVVRRVNAEWLETQSVAYATFGGGQSSTQSRSVYSVVMKRADNDAASPQSIRAVAVPVICAPLQRPSVPAHLISAFAHLDLADNPTSHSQLSVDILVGQDYYWDFVAGGSLRVEGVPLVAQETTLGFVLSGKCDSDQSPQDVCQLLCINDMHPSSLSRLWSLEGVGIVDSKAVEDESAVLAEFESSVLRYA